MNVTREVIADLWPVYQAGEASADTRRLIEFFLAADPDFAKTLRSPATLPKPTFPLTPDDEVRALNRTRELIRGNYWLRSLRLCALALTGLAIARVVQGGRLMDRGMLDGVAALAFWGAYLVVQWHARKDVFKQ